MIACATCRYSHVVPIPTLEEMSSVYRDEYYTKEKPLFLERHREDLEWWNLAYGDRYDTFEANIPRPKRRALDIGSGPGFFLLQGVKRGWEVLGVEPSAQAAAHARGLGVTVVEDFLTETIAADIGEFDAVHMSEVLEHLSDPGGMLRLAHRIMKPDGVICVVVPNDYNPFQFSLRSARGFEPWWVAPPHHINYFDFESLSRLLAQCGFQEIHREATFPIDMFLLMGEDYIGNDAKGRACHAKRKNFDLNLARGGMNEARRALYKALASAGIGREAMIFARKR